MKKLIALSGALLFVSAQQAFPHAQLSGSTPADESVLETGPQDIILDFSEPVRLTALSIQDESGDKRDLAPLPTSADRHFAISAPSVPAGRYVVAWRVVSADSHVMTGEFGFSIRTTQAQVRQPHGH
jgi:methionine-rich copper-binding protein CopC